MTNQLSAERASEIIGSIYDCVLDPAKWDLVLARICTELELANAVLGVIRLPQGIQIHQSIVGIPAEWLARVPDYTGDIVALWGGPQRIQQYPLDEPVIQSEAAGHEAMQANRYFREQVAPRGLIDAVAFAMIREANALGNVAFGRHGSFGAIDDEVVSGLRLLAPHFRRAVTISNLFDMKAIEAKTFSAALDTMSTGVILVDENLGIVHANSAAETMLADGDAIRAVKGVATLPTKAASEALQSAVERAARDEASLGQRGIGISARGKAGASCVVHVLPLGKGDLRQGIVQRATAALFLLRSDFQPSDAGGRACAAL